MEKKLTRPGLLPQELLEPWIFPGHASGLTIRQALTYCRAWHSAEKDAVEEKTTSPMTVQRCRSSAVVLF